MQQPIPLQKQSKRAQKAHHNAQRGSWNGVCPVTRSVPSGRVYNRKCGKTSLRASGY